MADKAKKLERLKHRREVRQAEARGEVPARRWNRDQLRALVYMRTQCDAAKAEGKKVLLMIGPPLFPETIPLPEIIKAAGMDTDEYGFMDIANDMVGVPA